MIYYLYNNAYHMAEDDETLPDGAVVVPRMPNDGEHWDVATSAFICDDAIVADMVVAGNHIEEVHRFKTMEAIMILSGITLTHGFLAAEAAQVGMTLEALAQDVYDKSTEERDTEVARRVRKVTARDQTE